ncbi:cold-shock protein [Pedobacter chitinilyticus]|uniref:Cold shock domain-containing protein n=1 Tax=Pedobacter chitinilyticus TaxID=2233776 RepID=A0A443YP17_9SPHI|nr:cold shock domain-containing protein [Pedobacter chitinilyticus]RWU05520.1 cold shock domain-containing protein [Pedobacter chitinilyticus]
MGESFAKKERNKSKAKKKQEKSRKMMDRKQDGSKTSFEDMIAYVDEFGNITDTPVTAVRSEIKLEDIQLGAAPVVPESKERTGLVSSYDPLKGYGFIIDDANKGKIFVHSSGLTQPIKNNDRVSFEREKGSRGYNAIMVKKINDNK